MCHVGSLPALFWSERKKKKKKRQYVLHYVPVLAGISQKCKRLKLYLHTSSSNSRHCSNVVIVVEGDLSHNLPALYQLLSAWALASFYQLLPYPPPFPLCAALSRANRTEKKKKKDAQAALVSSHAQSWLTSHPPTYTLSTIFQTADTAEAVPAFKKNYHGSEQLLCYLFTRVCSVFCFTPLFVWLL